MRKQMLEAIAAAKQKAAVRQNKQKKRLQTRRAQREVARHTAATEWQPTPINCLRAMLPVLGCGRQVPEALKGLLTEQFAHLKYFLGLLAEKAAAPESIRNVMKAIAKIIAEDNETFSRNHLIDLRALRTHTSVLLEAVEPLIFTRSSPRYMLTTDADVSDVVIMNTQDGWLLAFPDGQPLSVSRQETDQILNPQLRRRLGLSMMLRTNSDAQFTDDFWE